MKSEIEVNQERARLDALHEYRVVDSEREPAFDAISKLAASICGTPIAFISFITENRQWFKSMVGLEISESPREISFCNHAIQSSDFMEVPDTHDDPRFSQNPLVVNEPRIRFYAGVPLYTHDGFAIGTLCVIDRKPGRLSAEQREMLKQLCVVVMELLEIRRISLRNEHIGRLLEQSSDEIYIVDTAVPRVLDANTGALRNLQYTLNELRELKPATVIEDFDLEQWISLITLACEDGRNDFAFSASLRRKDGSKYPVEGKSQLWVDRDRLFAMLVVHDVTNLKRVENRLRMLAEFDSLTGLMNRNGFMECLQKAGERSARDGHVLAVMFLDLDHFKAINDALGHHAGDAALREFAKRLKATVRQSDTVARLAGDEFVVLLEGLQDSADVTRIAADILNAMKPSFELDGNWRTVTVSIGIAIRRSRDEGVDFLLRRADQALYAAKAAGRARYSLSDEAIC